MNREQIKTLKILAEIAREEEGLSAAGRPSPMERQWTNQTGRTNGSDRKRDMFDLILFVGGVLVGFGFGVEYRIVLDILRW